MPEREASDGPGRGAVTGITREAREGLMRAWLAVLSERHPDVTWSQ